MGPITTDLKPRQYLTFRLARQDFAMPADCIRGILPWHELQAPALSLSGVALLSGRPFPVIDLTQKLNLPTTSRGRNPCIIAVEIDSPQGAALIGFVADVVSELINVRARDFQRGKIRTSGRPRIAFDPRVLLAHVCYTEAEV